MRYPCGPFALVERENFREYCVPSFVFFMPGFTVWRIGSFMFKKPIFCLFHMSDDFAGRGLHDQRLT